MKVLIQYIRHTCAHKRGSKAWIDKAIADKLVRRRIAKVARKPKAVEKA